MSASDKRNPILSSLMQSSSLTDVHRLVDIMFAIQTQLSDIQDNQRKLLRAVRDLERKQRNRLADLKYGTQSLVKMAHMSVSEQLDEVQESLDEQNEEIEELEDGLGDLF